MSNTNLVQVVLSSGHAIYHLSKNGHVDTSLGIHLVGDSDLIVYWNGDGDACSHLWEGIKSQLERCKARGITMRPPPRGQLAYRAKDGDVLIPVKKTIFHLIFSNSTELLEIVKGLPLAPFNCRDKRCDESTTVDMRNGYFCVERQASNQWLKCLGNGETIEIYGATSLKRENQPNIEELTTSRAMVAATSFQRPGRHAKAAAPVAPQHHHSPALKALHTVTSTKIFGTALAHTPAPTVQVYQPLLAPVASIRATLVVPATTPTQISLHITATAPIAESSSPVPTTIASDRVAPAHAPQPVLAQSLNNKTAGLDQQANVHRTTKSGDSTKKQDIPRRYSRVNASLIASINKQAILPDVTADPSYHRDYIYNSGTGYYDTPGGVLVSAKQAHTLEAAKMRGKPHLVALLKEIGYEEKGYDRFTQDLGEQIVSLL